MRVTIPELALVVLIGPSGAGKSTWARQHFKPTEILSSDFCRGLVADDENAQAATGDAFAVLHFIAARRLAAGRLTVIDATNVQPESRRPLVALARSYHCLPVAIVLDFPERVCQDRNRARTDRAFGPHVIPQQCRQLRRSRRGLQREGFRHIFTFNSPEELASVTMAREPLWNNRKAEHGPFDIIGDVHGCLTELCELLARLGYRCEVSAGESGPRYQVTHPAGRKAVFLGDLVDRGPDIAGTLRLVMDMTESGNALCVPGNHESRLLRKLRGKDAQITHGLAESLAQLAKEPPAFTARVEAFIDDLVSHYVLDDGRLVVAHAGLPETMHGRGSGKVREFALYGETTGETDEYGLPVRYPWAQEYRGRAMVVYGHTPVPAAEWLNRTINIDTGCVFGGGLTALRYPEKELVAVPARQTYAIPARPLTPVSAPDTLSAQQQQDDMLDLADVIGKRIITTRLKSTVTVREENATAALEVISRFSANPKWLIYLPPTMSPCATSSLPEYLEYPAEAFAYYREQGVARVICEQKHMGSRVVAIICRDEEAARRRFGIVDEGCGIIYTRTGRRFFSEPDLERAMLQRLVAAATTAGYWDELQTDWLCLDAELMPWSAKAQSLLHQQYAPVGDAALRALTASAECLQMASARYPEAGELLQHMLERREMVSQYRAAYRRYCWKVDALTDMKLAPFHLLASENAVHTARDHEWHMTMLGRLADADPELLLRTPYQVLDVTDPSAEAAAARWWEELTAAGGEGMVVKPHDFIARGSRGLVQPAIKVRGREYLRIIYGPEYTAPQHLDRLRARGLAAKRSLALREFALGIEALERFVRREPLRRVHECVFGVLALESEPVDPRL